MKKNMQDSYLMALWTLNSSAGTYVDKKYGTVVMCTVFEVCVQYQTSSIADVACVVHATSDK